MSKLVQLAALVTTMCLFSCSDDPTVADIADKMGNAEMEYGWEGSKDVEGLGMTLKRIRVWRSGDNSNSGGIYSLIDVYSVEIWYQLEQDKELAAITNTIDSTTATAQEEGDSPENAAELVQSEDEFRYYRYSILTGLRKTEDGYLYDPTTMPGTTYRINPVGGNMQADGLYKYTSNEADGLVNLKYPSSYVYNKPLNDDGSLTETTLQHVNEISESGWENTYSYANARGQIAQRGRWQQNTNFETKGKLGCRVNSLTDGNVDEETFKFADIPLGNVLRDNQGHRTTANVEDENVLGDDDELWFEWTETWYMTGFKINEGKVRIMRSRQAPIYVGRELPGVDAGDNAAKLSDINGFVKTCNDAAKEAGGTFQFVTLGSSVLTPTLTNHGSANTYCDSLKDLADFNSEDLTDMTFGGCAFDLSGTLLPGTFDGSNHSGPLTTATSGLNFNEMSAIVETQL